MTSQLQIDANRRNALRSTGPISPEGRARSAQNSRKHGMRSEREQLAREEGIAYESRHIRWSANYGVETDPEEFLLNANLFLASDMDRVKFAYLELTQRQINNADDEEIKEACELGNRLFSDPRGVPVSLCGTRRFNGNKPGGPSWGSKTAPGINPEELLGKLASSAMGCYFILNVLEELLERVRELFLGRRRSAADGPLARAESCGLHRGPAGRGDLCGKPRASAGGKAVRRSAQRYDRVVRSRPM